MNLKFMNKLSGIISGLIFEREMLDRMWGEKVEWLSKVTPSERGRFYRGRSELFLVP